MFLKINWQSKCFSPKRNSLYWPLRTIRPIRRDLERCLSNTKHGSAIYFPRQLPWFLITGLFVHGELYQSSTRQLLILCLFAPGISQRCRSHPLADCAPFAISVITALPKGHTAGQLQSKVIQKWLLVRICAGPWEARGSTKTRTYKKLD